MTAQDLPRDVGHALQSAALAVETVAETETTANPDLPVETGPPGMTEQDLLVARIPLLAMLADFVRGQDLPGRMHTTMIIGGAGLCLREPVLVARLVDLRLLFIQTAQAWLALSHALLPTTTLHLETVAMIARMVTSHLLQVLAAHATATIDRLRMGPRTASALAKLLPQGLADQVFLHPNHAALPAASTVLVATTTTPPYAAAPV